MKELSHYLNMNYSVSLRAMPDGQFQAEVRDLPGVCAYGDTMQEAVEQLEGVKRTALELMLEQGKEVPVPRVRLEIPVDVFSALPERQQMEAYVVSR